MFGLLSTLALAVMAVSPVQALPPNCDRNTTILGGDTCNALCAREHVSTFQLRHVNPWINAQCNNLFAGDVICLGITGQDCNTTYVVQNGDSCDGIAMHQNISLTTLEANNPGICTNLLYDEVMCVSSTIYPYNMTTSS